MHLLSLDMYRGKRLLFGVLLLASFCWLPVRTKDYTSLNASTSELKVEDRLLSTPNPYFEMGIFQYNYSGITTEYYLSIRYALPIEQAITWMATREISLSRAAVLRFENGMLTLSDQNQPSQRDNIWSTSTDYREIVSAELLDTGKLVLKNSNGTEMWNSFDDSPPTDTLLPGQGMHRFQGRGHSLNTWQKTGKPAFLDDTYSFGWDAKGVLALSWTCPKKYLNWKGGSYIPAPDVYAAHTIQNVDKVYFHENLGHLYICSKPAPTTILFGGPNHVNVTTLKRLTLFPDGGLRILQYTINQTNQTSNQHWEAVANWVVSDRAESRTQCTTFGTCGPYSECISPIDDKDPVTCRCPGKDNITTKDWFTPIYDNDPIKGCQPPSQSACQNGTYNGTINPAGMLELPGVDMPWGGDYRVLKGNDSTNCKEECMKDCFCAGAVYSKAEQMCWMKNGALYNLGWPTVDLHGTDRISFLRNQTVEVLPKPAKKDYKWVKILVPAIGIPGVLLLIALGIFCLWRNEKVRRRVWVCGSCCKRPTYEIKFPGGES